MDFQGTEAQTFEAVKDYRGVKANNELLRLLVADEFNRIPKKNAVEVAA